MEINKIYCEDCLLTMLRMPDDFVTISVTSPPYNLRLGGLRAAKKRHYYDDEMPKEEYEEWIATIISELIRVTKYHVFFNIAETSNNNGIIKFILNKFDDYIKEKFIWAKQNPPSNSFPTQDTICAVGYEYIFCFSKDNPKERKFTYCNFSNTAGDYMKNIIIKPVGGGYKGHNFVFPEWLPGFFIKNFSKEGDLVYDPFMGSGTTAVKSHQLNRKWMGSEISPEYVGLAEKRMGDLTAQTTLFK